MKSNALLVIAAVLVWTTNAVLVFGDKKPKRPDLGAYTEKVKVENVPIVLLPNGHLQAYLPVELAVDQESGPKAEPRTPLVCKGVERDHKLPSGQNVSETVLKCGERVFVVTGLEFTPQR